MEPLNRSKRPVSTDLDFAERDQWKFISFLSFWILLRTKYDTTFAIYAVIITMPNLTIHRSLRTSIDFNRIVNLCLTCHRLLA